MNTFQKALLVAGALGLGSTVAAPAFAGSGAGSQAYVSGSSAIVLMNGASQSVGAELAAPGGTFFTGATSNTTGDVTVTPLLTIAATAAGTAGGLSINENDFKSLNVNAGALDTVQNISATKSATFTAAAAAALDAAVANGTLDAQVSIIRAGAGINGLD